MYFTVSMENKRDIVSTADTSLKKNHRDLEILEGMLLNCGLQDRLILTHWITGFGVI